MLKQATAAIVAITAMTASVLSFAADRNAQTAPVAEKPAYEIGWRQSFAPQACEGEVFPYQSNHCIAAIMAENGQSDRNVRVIQISEPTVDPLAGVYAELASDLRQTH